MKTYSLILISILTLLSYKKSDFECISDAFHALPGGDEITPNSKIILEGYMLSQSVIDSLNIKYPVHLSSSKENIPLNIEHKNKGMYSLTQVVLQPAKKLTPGETYQLKIDGLNRYQQSLLKKWNYKTQKSEPMIWTVSEDEDHDAPILLNQPRLVKKETIHYGCGPEVYAYFNLKARDNSDILVKTQLVDLTDNTSNSYFLNYRDGFPIGVGHGMCSGEFSYEPEHRYKVRFSLIDMSGNSDNKWTDWVEFDSPYESL